jgi:hypothetical protein
MAQEWLVEVSRFDPEYDTAARVETGSSALNRGAAHL